MGFGLLDILAFMLFVIGLVGIVCLMVLGYKEKEENRELEKEIFFSGLSTFTFKGGKIPVYIKSDKVNEKKNGLN